MSTFITRRSMGPRGLAAALTISLAMGLGACGGGSDETRDAEQGTTSVTAPADGFTISSALAELPDDRQWQMVGIADLAGAVEATGLQTSPDDLTWHSAVVGGFPLEDPQDTPREELTYAPVLASVPQLLDRAIQSGAVGELPEALGWSPADTTQVAHLMGGSNKTTEFAVATGPFPQDALGGLTDLGDGVWSLGDGEDGELFPESESRALDLIGRPVRLAQDGEQIAFSTATEPVRAWAGGQQTSTAADRPELAEPAEVLDEVGAISAVFTVPLHDPIPQKLGLAASPEQVREFHEIWQEQLIAAPFTSIAIGHGAQDGQGTVTIVYRFVAAEGAQDSAPAIEALLDGETFDGSRPVNTAVVVESVEVQDNLVIVTGTQPPGTSWTALHRMVMTGEPPFVLGG